jgi:hypothetical protein
MPNLVWRCRTAPTSVRTYERVAYALVRYNPRPRPFCKFSDGRLLVGTDTLHRTRASRLWRQFWRMKRRVLKNI